MTTDTTALQERIAEELYYDQHPEGRHRSEWPAAVYPDTVREYRDLAAAVLPTVEAELRAAKAAAQEPTDAEIEAGKAVLESAGLGVFDGHLPGLSEHLARKVLTAARAARRNYRQCPHGFHHPPGPHSCDGCWCEGERDRAMYGWDHDTAPMRDDRRALDDEQ